MKLKKLLKEIPLKDVKGPRDIEITGLSSNSKLVAPGHLFVAKKGLSDDGCKYIPEAIASGAHAVLTDIYDPSFKHITQLIHPQISDMEGMIASQFYQNPSQEMFLVGLTGTNGKTTTSYLIKFFLDCLSEKCGVIGTIEYIIGNHRYQATRTTPDVLSNHKMLRDMATQSCKAAVMEVTSHALHQNRVSNIDFDVAIFTNLTWDHLDYHGSMEEYAAQKSKLFASLNPKNSPKKDRFTKTAVINLDSPWASKMVDGVKSRIFTFSCEKIAYVQATDIKLSPTGSAFTILYNDKSYPAYVPLAGRYNVYNALAALTTMLARGFTLDVLLPLLANFPPVPGRIEAVPNPLNLKIFVDFAHTEDALINVLEALEEFKKGKIITVFGCGGDRDTLKRPKMAEAAEEHSDYVIVTTDNPRSEDPEKIARDTVKGFKNPAIFEVEIDRKKAIKKAISLATPDDIILIAGKGHETYQIFAHKTVEFDDRKIAYELAKEKAECLI